MPYDEQNKGASDNAQLSSSRPTEWNASRPHNYHSDRFSVRILNGLIEAVAIFLIAFSPIAFGATERWSKLVLESGVALMCAFWCFRCILNRRLAFAKSPLNWLIAGFLLVACVQLIPLPQFIATHVSPSTVHVTQGALPGAAVSPVDATEAARAAKLSPGLQSISVNRAAGRSFLYLVVAYAVAFLVVLNTFRTRAQLTRMLSAIVIVGFVVAMLGLLGLAAPNGKILWFRAAPTGAVPFGPFVNRNHFAGYLAMVVPLALGLMMAIRNTDKKVLLGFAASVMAVAVFATASRGGAISLMASALIFAVMLARTKAAKKNLVPLGIVGGIAAIGAIVVGVGPLLERTLSLVTDNAASEYRFGVWSDTLRMVSSFPLLGVGLGCFSSIFPAYKSATVQMAFTYVENDYLQLLAEMGIVGFAIGIAFIGMIFRNSFRSLTAKRSNFSRSMTVALAAAATSMLVHSFVDFNLHVPSNGLLFAIILALLVILSNIHISSHSGKTSFIGLPSQRLIQGETVAAPGTVGAFCLSSAVMCLLALCVAGSTAGYYAENELNAVEDKAVQFIKGKTAFDFSEGIHAVRSAVRKDAENAEWHHRAGLFYQTLGQVEARNLTGTADRQAIKFMYASAVEEFKKAVALDHFNSRYRASLAAAYGELGKNELAGDQFRVASQLSPTNAWLHRQYGEAVYEHNKQAGSLAFRHAIDLDPHYTRYVLEKIGTDNTDELRTCIPDNNEAIFEYAKFLINRHDFNQADQVLTVLLPRIEDQQNTELAARIFFRLGQVRQNTGMEKEAVACYLKAVALKPDQQSYYEELGYAYLTQQRYDEARRFLEQRLRMGTPEDGRVYLALAEIYENSGPAVTAHEYYRRAYQMFPKGWNTSRSQALQGMERTGDR